MKTYKIWIDKYHGVREWGEYWDAYQVGEEVANSFDEAMKKFISKSKEPDFYRQDETTGEWYCWGVRMFEGL